MSWLVRTFGSKRLVAAVAAALGTVLVPLLDKWFGINLSSTEVQVTLVAVLLPMLTYLLSQWHIDVATQGGTTTAAAIAREVLTGAGKALPSNTIAAKVATAVAAALNEAPTLAEATSTVAAASAALASAPPVPPVATPAAK